MIPDIRAQFVNGDFSSGSTSTTPHTINGWTNGYTQWVPQDFVPGKDPWVDLTGTGYGNGFYIEQTVYTSSKTHYKITFDLGTFFGWDLWDAGVTLTMNGNPLGGRIWHDSFTYTQDTIIYWKKMESIGFYGTDSLTTFRFTGDSRLVQYMGWGRGVGVIAIDNIALETANSNQVKAQDNYRMNVTTYPNPCNQELFMDVPERFGSQISYRIFDHAGKCVAESPEFQKTDLIRVSTGHLFPGSYIIELSDTEGNTGRNNIAIVR